jgi:hypothetical protein
MSIRPIPCFPPISLSLESREAGESFTPFTETGRPDTIPISTYLKESNTFKKKMRFGDKKCELGIRTQLMIISD